MVVVESVYSMDGDVAPLKEILDVSGHPLVSMSSLMKPMDLESMVERTFTICICINLLLVREVVQKRIILTMNLERI